MSPGTSAGSVRQTTDAVLLAAALAVRAPRLGHTCVDLDTIRRTADTDVDIPVDLDALDWPRREDWIRKLRTSALVGEGRPLRLEGSILYLDRYWGDEMQVAADLLASAQATSPRASTVESSPTESNGCSAAIPTLSRDLPRPRRY